jgi:hypothetical protein
MSRTLTPFVLRCNIIFCSAPSIGYRTINAGFFSIEAVAVTLHHLNYAWMEEGKAIAALAFQR